MQSKIHLARFVLVLVTIMLSACGGGGGGSGNSGGGGVDASLVDWAWMSGGNTVNQFGTYGTKGVADAANVPGARYGSVSWVDANDNLWLFGGNGPDSTGSPGYHNALWRFDGSNWTWISGSNTRDQSGIYGTRGVADAANVPGGRLNSVSWIDTSGNLWLFGGFGIDSVGFLGYLNDLWRFDGSNWTWVSGSNTAQQSGAYGTKGAPDVANVPGARLAAVGWINVSGDLLLFGGFGFDSDGSVGSLNDLWRFDGSTWTWISGGNTVYQSGTYGTPGSANAANVPGARFDSVSWIDASGNLWLFGGNGRDSAGFTGYLNDLWRFDGSNWIWVSGSNIVNHSGTYGDPGVANAANVPGARYASVSWTDVSGNLWLLGGSGYGSTASSGSLNDLWRFDGSNWTWISGSNTVNRIGTYGTRGVANATNVPGARSNSVSWIDSNGSLWLFGGIGRDSAGTSDILNDLWRTQP